MRDKEEGFTPRRGVFIGILLVGMLALVGGGFIRFSLKQLEANQPAIESGRLRDSSVALGDLHRLTLALATTRAVEPTEADRAAIRDAVDYLFVRSDTMKTAYRNAETERSRQLIATLDRLVELGDAFAEGRLDANEFLGAADGVLAQANRDLIAFINERKHFEALAIADQRWSLRAMTLTTAGLLVLFTCVSGCAAALWRAESDSEAKRRVAEKRARYLAYFDSLTGLANRAQFTERGAEIMAARSGDGPLVALFDLDGFKLVNDTHGHAVGDALLKVVGQRINDVIVKAGGLSARLGGDEFAAILPDLHKRDDVVALCERLMEAIRAPLTVEGAALSPRATIGVALAEPEHGDVGQVLRAADLALYQAKNAGRNTFAFYNAALADAARERRELESQLSEAIAAKDFELHYQPQVEVETGAIYGFEALTRWRRAEKLVAPNEFIPVAESTGMILELDVWGLETATRQVAQWIREGATPVGVSVNLSALHFRDDAIVGHVRRALAESRLPPHLLTLEVTETLLLEDWERIVQLIAELHDLGVRIALDDFGVGYSSLGYLRNLNADQLKIDRSLLSEVETSKASRAILGASVNLARALGIELLVEGVETRAQLDFLRELRCDRAQGYLFSPPLPVEAARALISGGALERGLIGDLAADAAPVGPALTQLRSVDTS